MSYGAVWQGWISSSQTYADALCGRLIDAERLADPVDCRVQWGGGSSGDAKGGGMAAVYELYAKEMYARTGYFAAWLPSMPIALGDVGVLKNNHFSKITTLAQLDVPFRVGIASKPTDLDYSTAE